MAARRHVDTEEEARYRVYLLVLAWRGADTVQWSVRDGWPVDSSMIDDPRDVRDCCSCITSSLGTAAAAYWPVQVAGRCGLD